MATAGRTVLFSSLTVAGALASLLVFPQRFLYSMGIGGSLVALIAAAIALIVLPAVLALLGERVNSLAPAFLQRRAAARRPAGERGLLVPALAARDAVPGPDRRRQRGAADRARDPVLRDRVHLGRRPGAAGVGERPPGRRRAARRLPAVPRHADHARARPAPTTATAERRRPRSSGSPGVADVRPPVALDGGIYAIDVISADGAAQRAQPGRWSSGSARDVAGARVTGFTAGFLDLQDSLVEHLPLVLAIVVVVTFVVLFLMTGSVILPLKQVLMNVLGLSADLRDPGADLPGRALRGPARLHEPGRARVDAAAAAVRGRLRPLDRLRRLPALADQGGARRRRLRPRGGRGRARAHRAGSSPPRRCCSRSRSAPSSPRR